MKITEQPAELSPAEIRRRAAEIRATRERQTLHFREGMVGQEFAASVLSVHVRDLARWSENWWSPAPSIFYRDLLRDALLAHEFLAGEGGQLLRFEACCRLLNADSEIVRDKITRACDPTSLVVLAFLRASEMLLLGDQPIAVEEDQLDVPERAIPRHLNWQVDRRAGHKKERELAAASF